MSISSVTQLHTCATRDCDCSRHWTLTDALLHPRSLSDLCASGGESWHTVTCLLPGRHCLHVSPYHDLLATCGCRRFSQSRVWCVPNINGILLSTECGYLSAPPAWLNRLQQRASQQDVNAKQKKWKEEKLKISSRASEWWGRAGKERLD